MTSHGPAGSALPGRECPVPDGTAIPGSVSIGARRSAAPAAPASLAPRAPRPAPLPTDRSVRSLTTEEGPDGRLLRANGVELFCETFGAPTAPAVLLLTGTPAPAVVWPDAFCRRLAGRGFRAVRFDPRDTGLSTHVDFAVAPYTLDDLAADALGLLDALGVRTAHLVGLAPGSELAFRVALAAPARIASVVVLLSSPDGRSRGATDDGNYVRARLATSPLSAAELARVAMPVLVLHDDGDLGHQSAIASIPGARATRVLGMRHALDPTCAAPVVDAVTAFCHAARRPAPTPPTPPPAASPAHDAALRWAAAALAAALLVLWTCYRTTSAWGTATLARWRR